MGPTIPLSAIYAFWIALIVSAISAAPLMKLLIQLKSRQTISAFVEEHQAKQGTPTMGGLIVVVGALITWIGLAINGFYELIEPTILFAGFAIIGFVDDYLVPKLLKGKRGLGWKQKILMELVLVLIPVLLFENRSPFAIFGGVYLILSFANAYNFTDGLDGLAGSVGVALLGGLLGICAFTNGGQPIDQILCVTLAAALIPFLFLNAPPAKVFMGDVGSLPIGAIIGYVFWRLATLSTTGALGDGALVILSLVMCAEIFPVPIQIASVKLRKKKVFFYTPIHHGFQKKGMPETTIVWRYALVQLVCSAAAFSIYWLSRSIVDYALSIGLRR